MWRDVCHVCYLICVSLSVSLKCGESLYIENEKEINSFMEMKMKKKNISRVSLNNDIRIEDRGSVLNF